MKSSREQFEEWIGSQDGMGLMAYSDASTIAWEAWQASRAAIEIELPSRIGAKSSWQDGPHMFADEVIDAIESEGLKVKS